MLGCKIYIEWVLTSRPCCTIYVLTRIQHYWKGKTFQTFGWWKRSKVRPPISSIWNNFGLCIQYFWKQTKLLYKLSHFIDFLIIELLHRKVRVGNVGQQMCICCAHSVGKILKSEGINKGNICQVCWPLVFPLPNSQKPRNINMLGEDVAYPLANTRLSFVRKSSLCLTRWNHTPWNLGLKETVFFSDNKVPFYKKHR